MEEMTIGGMQLLTAYGPLGAVAIYFIYKDMVLNRALTEALNKFTVALNVLCNGKVDD